MLVRLPLLLSHHGQLLMGVLLPLLTKTIASKGLVVEGIELVLRLEGPKPPALSHHLAKHLGHCWSQNTRIVIPTSSETSRLNSRIVDA